MNATGTNAPTGVEGIAASVEIHLPGDPGYDAGRATWNTAVEHRPLAVAVPRSTEQVIEVVRAARGAGHSIAIQSTGHGPTRAIRDAILISMTGMTEVQVNVEQQTARIGGGAKWQAVLDVVTPHGLAPLLGSTPDVSAVGYTLGGGLGWLARKYGTSADSVLAFEIVTATGELLRASADENADLFWGLRGAGAGHLGVVTAMEVQLYPVASVYGGNLFYPAEMAVEVLQRWRAWILSLPDDITSAVTMLNFPPVDEVPEELRGGSFVLVRGAFDGPMEEGERLLSYWREWKEPLIDQFGPLHFDRIDEVSQDPLDPVPNEGTGLWLKGISDATIAALTSTMFPDDGVTQLVQTEIRHAGGALRRGSPEASAFGNRDASMLLEIVGITPTEQDVAEVRAIIDRVTEQISPDLTGGHYLNYVEGDDRRNGVEKGIGAASSAQLAALKARIDPENVFDHGLDVTRVGATTDRPA